MSGDGDHGAGRPGVVRTARVVAVQDDLAAIALDGGGDRLIKNELVTLKPSRADLQGMRLRGEILRVHGARADVQVFESTAGLGVGDAVELEGQPLSALLGPGLLGQVFDGLQRPLEAMAARHGVFLPRGAQAAPLAAEARFVFHAQVRAGDRVRTGGAIGFVEEGPVRHIVFAPFDLQDWARVVWVEEGPFGVADIVGELETPAGRRAMRLAQAWPVRRSLGRDLAQAGVVRRVYPTQTLFTTQRIIDTFFPIALGGTACIPGPFGAGKTILQNLIARFASVDVVVVVACGERAGEVVETMEEFARLTDPRTGGALMARTIIICNTSAMPVAAREASIHMGATMAEYYRLMGLDVLLLADSTSRWAQALRELSGRLEEPPGDEGYPASLASEIKAFYERAGVIAHDDGRSGSLTLIGTVSPAGGNFEEPVTQATLSTVKCFLGLSSERAYRRAYPAIDPLQSWSRYPAQLAKAMEALVGGGWPARVEAAMALLRRGEDVARMMKVAGDDGVSDDDALAFYKAQFLDAVFLQQDAFDAVDASCPFAAQVEAFGRVERVLRQPMGFSDRDAMRGFFSKLAASAKAINTAVPGSIERTARIKDFDALMETAPPLSPGGLG